MNKILSILYISYKNYTAYISDIIWTNIVLILRILVISILYWYLYNNYWVDNKISWFTVVQVTYAVIIAQVVSTSEPKISDEIELDIKSWKIASYLLNPIDYIYYKFLEFFPIFIHNILIWLTIWLLIWFLVLWVFPLSVWGLLWWFVLLIWSMFTVFFWYMIIWLLAFYVESNEPFRFIYSKADMILWWNLIPIPFLPWILQFIAFASPFAYFWYTTWLIFTNFEMITFLKYLSIQLVWLFINLFICIGLYNHAKNKLTINWW
jgi:ABC-type uncharacterized transport system permease subunit